MGQVTINGVAHTVEDDVQKYIEDCERDVKNALAAAEGAKVTIQSLTVKVDQAIRDGEAKVRAAEAKLMGWVEARAHSFFLAVDGDFHRVADFLKHVAQGLEPHMQPATLGGGATPTSAPAVQAAPAPAPAPQPAPAPAAAPAPASSSEPAPAPAAPASAASAAAPSAPALGS